MQAGHISSGGRGASLLRWRRGLELAAYNLLLETQCLFLPPDTGCNALHREAFEQPLWFELLVQLLGQRCDPASTDFIDPGKIAAEETVSLCILRRTGFAVRGFGSGGTISLGGKRGIKALVLSPSSDAKHP